MEQSPVCVFCGRSDLDSSVVGETYSKYGISAHQYCLYFSSGLGQNGRSEAEGISGFLIKDIMAEIRRASKKRMFCSVCRMPGKFIGCSVPTCNKGGHYPCLFEAGYLFQHCDVFNVYCPDHAPQQPRISTKGNETCCICLNDISEDATRLFCPLCHTLFHKPCVQMQACTAGSYFFRCPMCNNSEEFVQEMLRMGIAVPQRDAKWETEDYFGLEFEESKVCPVENCLCPLGREFLSRRYKMLKCETCGQWMGHSLCLPGHPKECAVCAEVTNKIVSKTTQLSTSEAATQTEEIQPLFPVVSIAKSRLVPRTRPTSLPVSLPLAKLILNTELPKHDQTLCSSSSYLWGSELSDQPLGPTTPKKVEREKLTLDIAQTQPAKRSRRPRMVLGLGISPSKAAALRSSSSSYPERLRHRSKRLSYKYRTNRILKKQHNLPRPRVKMLEPILCIERLRPEDIKAATMEETRPTPPQGPPTRHSCSAEPVNLTKANSVPVQDSPEYTTSDHLPNDHNYLTKSWIKPPLGECQNSVNHCSFMEEEHYINKSFPKSWYMPPFWSIRKDSVSEFKFFFYRAPQDN